MFKKSYVYQLAPARYYPSLTVNYDLKIILKVLLKQKSIGFIVQSLS